MSNNFNLNENISALFSKLQDFLTSKTVIGEPIQVGDATLIPIINVSFGLGSGGGEGTETKGNSGIGGGAGVCAKVAPTAIMVIKDGNVEMLPIKKSFSLEKLIDMVPGIVDKVKESTENKDCCCKDE